MNTRFAHFIVEPQKSCFLFEQHVWACAAKGRDPFRVKFASFIFFDFFSHLEARFGIHMKNYTILSEIHRNRSYQDPFRAGGPRGWGIAKACCKDDEQAIEPVARGEYHAVSDVNSDFVLMNSGGRAGSRAGRTA